jgi:hypothetical protein
MKTSTDKSHHKRPSLLQADNSFIVHEIGRLTHHIIKRPSLLQAGNSFPDLPKLITSLKCQGNG